MLSDAQLRAFGSDGYLVVPDVVSESVLADLDAEVAALVVGQPAPANEVASTTTSSTRRGCRWPSARCARMVCSRGDVVLAHYLLAHNQSGNMWNPLRR